MRTVRGVLAVGIALIGNQAIWGVEAQPPQNTRSSLLGQILPPSRLVRQAARRLRSWPGDNDLRTALLAVTLSNPILPAAMPIGKPAMSFSMTQNGSRRPDTSLAAVRRRPRLSRISPPPRRSRQRGSVRSQRRFGYRDRNSLSRPRDSNKGLTGPSTFVPTLCPPPALPPTPIWPAGAARSGWSTKSGRIGRKCCWPIRQIKRPNRGWG